MWRGWKWNGGLNVESSVEGMKGEKKQKINEVMLIYVGFMLLLLKNE
jgi:hypothetical protein